MNILLNRTAAVSSLIILFLISAPAEARPVPALDLNALVSESDLIVVGEVIAVSERERTNMDVGGGSTQATRMAASLRPYRVLKGERSDVTIYFEFIKTDFGPFKPVVARQFGIFFLKRKSELFAVTNPYYPFLVAARKQPTVGADVLENVISEIANVISLNMPRSARNEAVQILRHVKSKVATEALRHAVADADLSIRMRAHAALLWQNDMSAMSEAVELLLNPPSGAEQSLLGSLAASIEGVSDPEAIVFLKRLRSARQPSVRRAATGALRRTCAEAAIPLLLLSLSDVDQQVRYQAVLGLAEITGQYDWAPAVDLFQRDEQAYLEHWKTWGKTR